MESLRQASVERLASIYEIGDVIAQSVYDFFHGEAGRHTISELKHVGVDPKVEKTSRGSSALTGKTVVVTGAMKKFKREEIERLITDLGGRAAGTVSKKTSFIVAGEDAGSKLAKAKELGIEILTEEEFLKRVGRD